MAFHDYWYIVAESRELTPGSVISRCVLDEWLVCYRGADGTPALLRDRCLHRGGRLSDGTVRQGALRCPYHGWTYDGAGTVISVPSMSEPPGLCNPPYPMAERDGYVYVRLNRQAATDILPFAMPHYQEPGWKHLRLQNRFASNVANCVENFIDIPHTAFVHAGIFRRSSGERIEATVAREGGAVHVSYRNERGNLGRFQWFLNPHGEPVAHTDSFYTPNVTSVRYELARGWVFVITSQAVPVSDSETLVYTDLTYRFGPFTSLAAWFVRRHGQRIIDQDIEILGRQMEVIRKYGGGFTDTPADLIHRYVDSLRKAVAQGEDPRALPRLQSEIEFRI